MRRARKRGEPVLPLINVVVLLLVFFLIAGTLARPRPADIELAVIDAAAPPALQGALAVARDGRLFRDGAEVAPEALSALVAERDGAALRLMPDRELPAADLLALARALGAAGAAEIRLVGVRR